MTEPTLDAGRNETPFERLDRNFADLLQELRVMQTGVQLLAGFLLTLPFQSRFEHLDRYQEVLYLSLVVLAGLTTSLVLVPVAVHRRLFGRHVKERLVAVAHRMVLVCLAAVGLLIVGIVVLVFDVVIGRTGGWIAGGGVALTTAVLFIGIPHAVANGRRSLPR